MKFELTKWTKNHPSRTVTVWDFTVQTANNYHTSPEFSTKEEAQEALLQHMATLLNAEMSEKEEETFEF